MGNPAAVDDDGGSGTASFRMPRLGRFARWCGGIVVAAGLCWGGVAGVRWALWHSETTAKADDLSLEAQWNTTISRLGIEPIYPPQEDIAVGDLFAVVTSDDQREPEQLKTGISSSFLSRAVKLGHVPVTHELDDAYADVPIFDNAAADGSQVSPAVARTAMAAPVTAADAAHAGSFGQGHWRDTLPRAAFPGLTITFSGGGAAGASGADRGWFGYFKSRDATQKLELRTVETYGLPNIAAALALRNYCTQKKLGDVCHEDVARTSLKGVPGLGERVMVKNVNPNSGKDYYAVAIKIFMISRVYFAREILEEWSVNDAEGASGHISLPSAPSFHIGDTGGGTAQVPPADGAGGTTAPGKGAEQRLEALEKQISALQNGGIMTYHSDNGSEQLLHEKFARPIAIGFRSVEYDAPPAAGTDTDATKQASSK